MRCSLRPLRRRCSSGSCRRYRAASPPLRRVVGPVYLFTLEALAALVASGIVSAFSESAALWLEYVALISLALMPLAFLAGILRTRLARAGIADLAIALGNGKPLRDALADALGDPSLELAYWSPQHEAWVDEEGRELADPIARGARAAAFVEHGGQRVAALIHDRTLTDQRGLVDAVAATASLAFEKERLQAEIRAQYRFLQTIIDTAPSLLSVVDTEGRIRNFNRAVEVASGLEERSRIEGRYFWEIFIDPDERDEMVGRFREASPGFPPSEYENTFTNAGGQERVIAWQTAPLFDEHGNVVRIIAGGIDITERKRREVELQRQWDFANVVASTIPSFVVVTDHDAVIVPHGANRAFCAAFAWPVEALVGSSFLDLVADDDEFAARMAIAGAANGVPQAERESRWLTRDGRERTVAWTATPILDQWGSARVLLSGADITERKRQEEEVRASRTRIVAATDAARRRLERNLHDGAQQRLAALSLSLRLAESRLTSDVDQAAEILVTARSELAQALEELRELARGLHPNVLTDRGLGPALEALVGRSPIPVAIDVPEERLPPAIEAAAYYVTAEALTNVVKYAGASEATVRIVAGRRARRRRHRGRRRRGRRRRPVTRIGPRRARRPRRDARRDVRDLEPARRRDADPRHDSGACPRMGHRARGIAPLDAPRRRGASYTHARVRAADRNRHVPLRRRRGLDAARPERRLGVPGADRRRPPAPSRRDRLERRRRGRRDGRRALRGLRGGPACSHGCARRSGADP